MTLHTSRLKSSPACPVCAKVLDAVSSEDPEAQPGPGSLTVCVPCQSLLVFTDDMRLRQMTRAEFEELPTEVANQLTRYQVCSGLAVDGFAVVTVRVD